MLNRKNWIKDNWHTWFNAETDYDKIETALSLLSKFHYGLNYKPGLSSMLDKIADDYKNKMPYGDELDLSFYLFQEIGFTGAVEDYNNPFNSNAVYVIKEKKGLPITLSLIYALIGNRLGYSIKGCNFPGHFFAKFEFDNEMIFVDCFNGGRIFFEGDVNILLNDFSEDIVKTIIDDTPAEQYIRRILNNLINSYSIINDKHNIDFFTQLIKAIP